MSEFTRESIAALEQDIVKALKSIEKKHDVKLNLEQATKGFYTVGFKLTAVRSNPYRTNYLKHAAEIAAKPEWLDRVFWTFKSRSAGIDEFQVIGLKLPSKQIVCDKLDNNGKLSGKYFLFSVEQLAEHITRMDAKKKSA
jgi:hypothetical protein